MLRSIKNLIGYNVVAADGEIGTSNDFVIDDHTWSVRYLAVATDLISEERLLLLPAVILQRPDWAARMFPVSAATEQIKAAPLLKKDKPVTQSAAEQLAAHYASEPYWVRGPTEGLPPREQVPGDQPDASDEASVLSRPAVDQTHVVRARDLLEFSVHGKEGEVGQVDDLIVSDDSWQLLYVASEVGLWLGRQKILLAVEWLRAADRDIRALVFDVGRGEINRSPEYDPNQPVNRRYEEILFDAYGRPKYWEQSVE